MLEKLFWPKRNGYTYAQDKITVYYTANAFAKIVTLVEAHPLDVGWHMLTEKYKDGIRVYDILVHPQSVRGFFIEDDEIKYPDWYESLTTDQKKHMNGFGHSAGKFNTFATDADIEKQYEAVSARDSGLYLYQIWNKELERNSFVYDIDKQVYYGKENILFEVEFDDTCSTDFLLKSFLAVTRPENDKIPSTESLLEDNEQSAQ